jgi:hypothetical protein
MPRGIALSDAGAALLHRRTEGSAAGLRLAVISLAGHPDPERFVAEFSGSDRTVAEAIRHTQAAGDWPDAARLLADHSFSLTPRRPGSDHPGAGAGLPPGSRRR